MVALTKHAVLIQRGNLVLTNARIKYFHSLCRRLRFRRWDDDRSAMQRDASRAIDRAMSPMIPRWWRTFIRRPTSRAFTFIFKYLCSIRNSPCLL